MKARVFWIVLALAFGGLVAYRVSAARAKAATAVARPPDAALVRTTKVARADLRELVSFTGNVRARNEVDIFPKLPGRVEELRVAVGDKVHRGDVLAVVEHKEVGWQAKAAAAQAQSAQAGVKAAEAAILLAQTNVDASEVDFQRTKTLFEAGSAPQVQLDGMKLKLDVARAQLAQAKAGLANAQAAVLATEAQSGLAQQQLANARMESPINGVVTRRNVLVGTQAGPQTLAFSVQDTSALKLEGSVDGAAWVRLARGKPVDITVEEFPGETFRGRVDVLSPALDPVSRRATVEILIDNHAGRLLPQMFAHADAEVGRLKDALVVPKEALLEAPGGAIAFRVKDGRVEQVRPKLGSQDRGLVAVLGGLDEGDELALTALGSLSDGAAVRVAPTVSRVE